MSGEGTAVVVGAGGGIGGAVLRRVVASGRYERVLALTRSGSARGGEPVAFDLEDEASIAAAAARAEEGPPVGLVFVATGLLHASGVQPERGLKAVDPGALARLFAVNAIGPALIAKHFTPLMPRRGRSVFAALSARVGSLGDNRLGGWHGYRASKAALNMLVRNVAIELARTHPEAVCALLHPGTVDTGLSAPFQRGVTEGGLFTPEFAAERLLAVLDGLSPEQTGGCWAWDGSPVPW